MDLEIDEIAPVLHPRVEERAVIGFHHLIATLERLVDPARNVDQTVRRHPAPLAEPAIHGRGVLVLEVLDHQVCHHPFLPLPPFPPFPASARVCYLEAEWLVRAG